MSEAYSEIVTNAHGNLPCIGAKASMEEEFRLKKGKGTLSKAHVQDHVYAVANTAGATGAALINGLGYYEGFILPENAARLSVLSGILHDIEREATEEIPHGPESAKRVLNLSRSENHRLSDLSQDDLHCLYVSIALHEQPFSVIGNVVGDPLKVPMMHSMLPVVAHALKTGDAALEASGYRVIDRRSFFVGKERMLKTDADGRPVDLHAILTYPNDSHLAFLGETMIRLYGKNPIDAYPAWLKPFAQEWHAIQYLAYQGLLRYEGMTEEQAAQRMLDMGFTKFTPKLVEQIVSQRHLSGEYFSSDEYPVLSEEIRKVMELDEASLDDLAQSTYDVVNLFARADSPEAAIEQYKARGIDGRYAPGFMEGIIGYREGSEDFLDDFGRKIENAVRDVKGV
jgi:hypothetical protein